MKQPFIIIIDDDPQVLRAIQRDVKSRYRDDYRIMAASSAQEAHELISELKLKNETVALFICDQRMPETEGVEFLANAMEIYPDAKKVLLTAYSDIEAAIKAINEIHLDYYLLKPWSPPEEKLYPVIDDLLDVWHMQFRPDHEGIRVIGFQWSPRSHEVKEFLSGNLIPYIWMDVEDNEHAKEFMISAGAGHQQLPLIILKDGKTLFNPGLKELATATGLQQKATAQLYDVVIIGAGPSGLAASVYGSTEGLKTLLIEKNNPGGQASSSARIENYLGFPQGLSGSDLTRRAITQTIRFGTEILTPQEVSKIENRNGYKHIYLKDGSEIHSRAVIVSTGIAYRKLEIPGIEKYTGAGVYYGAASVEAHACKGKPIYIVGGGNSACQAAMYMCKFASEVNILIRKERLGQVAANYLVQQISATPNIKVIPQTEVKSIIGDTELKEVVLVNNVTGEETTHPAKALFIYIGAKPTTDWLPDEVIRDEKGFVVTGSDLAKHKQFRKFWKEERNPYPSETAIPGVFASGDVRHQALSGISSAVGEGVLAVRYVRKYLQES
jgi:thioredoxin reductase (NADPH)